MDQTSMMSLLMMVVMFGAMYFLMIRPQKKREKETKQMRDALSSGDEIITIGGIHGKVVKVSDEIVTIELEHAKQRMNFSRWAVGSVVKKGKDSKKSDDGKEEKSEKTVKLEKPSEETEETKKDE